MASSPTIAGALSAALLTGPLRRAVARALPDRPFNISFWDGTTVPATHPDAPTLTLTGPAALAHMVRRPGPLGFFRAYVDGSLAFDDLDAAWRALAGWKPMSVSSSDKLRLAASTVLAALPAGVPRTPELELRLTGEVHSLQRDSEAVRYHYDVGNEFFALFLDESMTYSCAVFSRGATTLEEAQRTKLDLVATKLQLRPGMRVLDVGCGWGAFAIHAAREYGVHVLGITLAEEQAKLAQQRVADAGLSDRVDIRLADYRSLGDQRFDAISSIGMVEHVGESNIDLYARTLADLLVPGGLLLNHGIALTKPVDDPTKDPIVMRYVFPDGEPVRLWRIEQAFENVGLHTQHIEGFQQDYADTLYHWYTRLDRDLPRAIQLAGSARTRIWRLYLRISQTTFEDGAVRVYQVLTRKPTDRSAVSTPS